MATVPPTLMDIQALLSYPGRAWGTGSPFPVG